MCSQGTAPETHSDTGAAGTGGLAYLRLNSDKCVHSASRLWPPFLHILVPCEIEMVYILHSIHTKASLLVHT